MESNVMKKIVGFFRPRKYLDLKPIQHLNKKGVRIYTPSFFYHIQGGK